MERRRRTSYALVAGTLAFVMGCSGSSEQKILEDFFRASRLRDNATLGNFATTSFDPRTDGVVQDFDVVSVSDERPRPLPLRQYAEALESAKAADQAFAQQKRAYQNANITAIDRISKAPSQKAVLPRDFEVKAAWDKWVADQATHHKAVSDAQRQLAAARGVAELSLARQRGAAAPVDVTQLAGEMIAKDVIVNATVRDPGGQVAEKKLKIVMQRAKMKDADDKVLVGRWIVTSVSPA